MRASGVTALSFGMVVRPSWRGMTMSSRTTSGPCLAGQFHGLDAIARFADDFHIGLKR